ncbi:restriction endonuclease subunit S [Clostridium perfringens]|uniref:restriction endonuclease subunit S n=1 Tax=Clostridium perfringens TaxID=1502 RepID=UPI003F9078E3
MSRNVPKLRFKGFEDEWENYKLGSFSEKITEKNKGFKVKNVISNSAKNGLISQRDFFEKDIANKNNIDGYYIIKNGDFVYNPRKSNEAPYGPINKYKFKDDGVVSPLYFCFRINNKVSNEYLEEYFKSSKWYRYVHMNSDQGARHDRVSIKDSEVMNMKIKLPSLQEQEKIANFLSKVDSIIEKQEKKVEYWNSYKKGMMQKIFSQKIRFKDENGRDYPKWESKRFKEILIEPKKEKVENPSKMELLTVKLHCKGVEKTGKYPNETKGGRPYYIRNEGELLIGRQNMHNGGIGLVKNECDGNIASNAISSFIIKNSDKGNIKYIYLFLSNSNFYKRIDLLIGGTGQKEISKSELDNLKIEIPLLEEQNKIVKLFSNVDNIIEKENKKLEELKQWKKGLLQQMFV